MKAKPVVPLLASVLTKAFKVVLQHEGVNASCK